MKRAIRFWCGMLLFLCAFTAMAADAAATAAPVSDAKALWLAIIPAVVPVILALLKTLVPKIPKWWLPILAPLLGAGAELALHFAGLSTSGVLTGAILGTVGTWCREVADQVRKAMAA